MCTLSEVKKVISFFVLIFILRGRKKYFLNEQSKDAAAKKELYNTSGVEKSNNYFEDIYIPPYNNTH